MTSQLARRIQNRFLSICHQEDPVPLLSHKAAMFIVLKSMRRLHNQAQRRLQNTGHPYHPGGTEQTDNQLVLSIPTAYQELQAEYNGTPTLVSPGTVFQLHGNVQEALSDRSISLQRRSRNDANRTMPAFSFGTWHQGGFMQTSHDLQTYQDLLGKCSITVADTVFSRGRTQNTMQYQASSGPASMRSLSMQLDRNSCMYFEITRMSLNQLYLCGLFVHQH